MARNHELAVDVGGMKSAVVRDDGSLIIMARNSISDLTENDWRIVVEITPVGVKNLKDLLDRDAQLRNEAVDVGQTCPRCAGSGRLTFNSGRRYTCGLCNGSGHV
jgi:ribosomal protein S27AE